MNHAGIRQEPHIGSHPNQPAGQGRRVNAPDCKVVRAAIEEQLFSANPRVSTAAVELVCNIVQSPKKVMSQG